MNGESTGAGDPFAYAYRPSLLGAAWEFRLAGDGIDWAAGRKGGHIPFRACGACACRIGLRACSRTVS